MDSTIVENGEPTRESPTLSNDDANTTALSHVTGEVVQIQAPPDWAHEVAASRVGRQSRASSIFSTRTRLSNLTLDDARSVEIKAGGLSFRISRDGSRITDVTAPPPYPGPPVDDVVEEELHERDASSTETEETSSREGSTATTPHLSARRLSTDEEELETHSLASSSATLPAAVYDIPEKLKRALGIRGMNASSPSLQPPIPGHPRRTQSDTSNYGWLRSWSKISAPESSYASQASSNSAAIGRSENKDEANDVESTSTSTIKPAIEEEEVASGSENEEDERAAEISSHYSGLMRDMDREHRKKLHEKDKELSQLRQLLHEKDIVLRQALRDKDIAYEGLKSHIIAKDVFIEDLKSKLIELEDGVEARLEKARHAVENMWEVRWKTYEKLLLDRMLPGISEDVQEMKLDIADASEITEKDL